MHKLTKINCQISKLIKIVEFKIIVIVEILKQTNKQTIDIYFCDKKIKINVKIFTSGEEFYKNNY